MQDFKFDYFYGSQAEQFSFWFQGKVENDYIHSYPVVYSSGNHDQGGVYFDTYVYSIQDEEYGAEVEVRWDVSW